MTAPLLFYFHGFQSSPGTQKAAELGAYLRAQQLPLELLVPALPDKPEAALHAAEAAITTALQNERTVLGLLGSSMGGFYATILAQRYDLRAVLINPAVRPQRLIANYLGRHHNPYTGVEFELEQRDIAALQQMSPVLTRPELFWLLQQEGDEVLNYRDAVSFYAGCRQTIESGGNHRFEGFDRYLPDVIRFLREK